jgi:hypothetical protein
MRNSRVTVQTAYRAAPLIALVIALAGCSAETPGEPNPTGTTGSVGSTTSTRPPTNTSARSSLGSVDPCGLLEAADVAAFGANPGRRRGGSSAPSCDWTVPGGKGGFSVDIHPDRNVDQIVVRRGRLTDQVVGTRQGKRLEEDDGPGACMVSIPITDTSRVDFQGTANTNTAKACEYATRVAELIEPKLPKE